MNIPHPKTLRRRLPALLLLALAACSDGTGPEPDLSGGVLATFSVEGETFKLWSTNAETIAQLVALRDGTSDANIPNGPLLPGTGVGNHNSPWSWHLDPDETAMAENTIEVCSAVPSYVEEELATWMELGQYCPWSAVLVELEDLR